jgi:hypothetical protein
MSETTQTTEADPAAASEREDVIARLAGRGEQTLSRLAELPGGARALGAMNDLRNRVDELGKKVRGIDELERRVTALESELVELKQAQGPAVPGL